MCISMDARMCCTNMRFLLSRVGSLNRISMNFRPYAKHLCLCTSCISIGDSLEVSSHTASDTVISTVMSRVMHDGLGGSDVIDGRGNLFVVVAYGWVVRVAFHRLSQALVQCWAAALCNRCILVGGRMNDIMLSCHKVSSGLDFQTR